MLKHHAQYEQAEYHGSSADHQPAGRRQQPSTSSRITGRSINTVSKLLVDIGIACSDFQDRTIRNLTSRRIEYDEIWAFCYARAKNVPQEHRGDYGFGDIWTWVAIDPDTKLIALAGRLAWRAGGAGLPA